ncbi:hypothetical protein CsSME_00009213 [Camellia sinensis var. sinensis]
MGKQLCAILILCSMVISITAVHGIAEDPISVEKWFDNLTNSKQKVTKLEFYFQDMRAHTTNTSPTLFGRINMVDNPLTVGPESQGIYGASLMEEMSLLTLVNLAFKDGKYDGSTLALLDSATQYLTSTVLCQLSVVQGLFRLAQGIATAKTYSINATSGYGVVHYYVTIKTVKDHIFTNENISLLIEM